MYFEEIFREFDKRRIKYLVIGGIAVNLYGFQRVTGDLDIMLSFDESNLENFVKIIKADNINIPLISIDDLIKLKRKAGRGRDKIDVKALLKIKELR